MGRVTGQRAIVGYANPSTNTAKGIGCFGWLVRVVAFIVVGLVILLVIASAHQQSSSSPTVSNAALVAPTATPAKAQAVYLDPRLITADPQAYVGRNVIVQGRAINVEQQDSPPYGRPPYTWIALLAGIHGRLDTESLVVELAPQIKNLLKDECYRVYGIIGGTETVQVILTGASNDATVIHGYAIESAPSDSSFSCMPP